MKIKKIKKILSKREAFQKHKRFDVLVAATMSAGKSTLINALIGNELLHSANEATTACLTSIEHDPDGKHFHGRCYSGSEIKVRHKISAEEIQAWNSDPTTTHIKISGKFKTNHLPEPGLVLHDTPGANNSQDGSHARIMLEAVRTVPLKTLCYVLNASQLGTKDDQALLIQMRDRLRDCHRHQVIFALNKIDLLDPERGEKISDCVLSARRYLESIGFEQAIIVPTMADVALYARKALDAAPLTRVQRLKLSRSLNDLDHIGPTLLNAGAVPDSIQMQISRDLKEIRASRRAQDRESHKLHELIACSGIRTIETLIHHQRRTGANQ